MPDITGYAVLDGLLLLIAAALAVSAIAFAIGLAKSGEVFDDDPAQDDHTRPPTE